MSWSTSAWILYSVAMTSRDKPAALHEIIAAADALNHAIPTLGELQRSLGGLMEAGLITREGKCYSLTTKGSNLVKEHTRNDRNALDNLIAISAAFRINPKPTLDQTITEEDIENSYNKYWDLIKRRK